MVRHASLLSALTLAVGLAMPGFAQQQPSPPRLLVIPFTTLNVGDNQEWIGRAVQEDIIADFGHTNQFLPVAFQGQIVVEDNATAVSLAHKANATLVIRGSAQMVDKDLRITAQMIDARTGDTVTTASVTGPTSDLLKLEDGLSSQLRTNLAIMVQAAEQQQPAAAQPDTSQQVAGPVTYVPYTPASTYDPMPATTTILILIMATVTATTARSWSSGAGLDSVIFMGTDLRPFVGQVSSITALITDFMAALTTDFTAVSSAAPPSVSTAEMDFPAASPVAAFMVVAGSPAEASTAGASVVE